MRPQEFAPAVRVRTATACPFCGGNESMAPGERAAVRRMDTRPNTPGWRVRAIPNMYPAVGGRPRAETRGVHEVIVESPRHIVSTSELSDAELGEVLWLSRDRILAARRDPALAGGLLFKNVGPEGGASIEHLHSQFLALPFVPPELMRELDCGLDLFQRRGECAFCRLVRDELTAGERLVSETERFVAVAAYAGRFAYETWLLPKRHASHFESLARDEADELASLLRRTICAIESATRRVAYNYFVHSGPFDSERLDHYHWHIEVLPRVTNVAGFEWGAGCFINPVPPEQAAAFLRENLANCG